MDDSSKGVIIAVGVGEAKISLTDQLSTTVSRLERRTSVFSHNSGREPRKGIHGRTEASMQISILHDSGDNRRDGFCLAGKILVLRVEMIPSIVSPRLYLDPVRSRSSSALWFSIEMGYDCRHFEKVFDKHHLYYSLCPPQILPPPPDLQSQYPSHLGPKNQKVLPFRPPENAPIPPSQTIPTVRMKRSLPPS